MSHEARIRRTEEGFAKHRLVVLADTPQVKAFRVAQPGTGNLMFEVVSTPYGVTLFGDVCFDDVGPVGAMKPLGWFVGELSPDYLAGKFGLSQGFRAELARAHVEDAIQQMRARPEDYSTSPGDAERIEELWSDALGFESDRDYIDTWAELLGDNLGDGCPGWGRDPRSVAVLAAAQRTFRRLFWESVQSIEPTEPRGTRLVATGVEPR